MTMPELPRRIKRREADFGVRFRNWVKNNKHILPSSCSFELKDTRGKDMLPFDALEAKQSHFANKIQSDGFLARVTVGTPGTGDYLFMKKPSVAFIVVKFPNLFCIIKANEFHAEQSESKRKSLTKEKAIQIAWDVIE